MIKIKELESRKPIHASTQTLGYYFLFRTFTFHRSLLSLFISLSIVEEHQKKIEQFQENEIIYKHEIERLTEERDNAQNLLNQWKEEQTKTMRDYEAACQLQIQEREELLTQLQEKLKQQEDNLLMSLNNISSTVASNADRYF